eukprot:3300253-Rhodomonas_salina.1
MARVKLSALAVGQSSTLLWKLSIRMRSIAIEMADHPLVGRAVAKAWRYSLGAMETRCLNERETSSETELFLLQAPWLDLQLVPVLSSAQRFESVARAAARAVPRLNRHAARG